MGRTLGLKFSKHGYDVNQNPIQDGGKLKKTPEVYKIVSNGLEGVPSNISSNNVP